MISKTIYRIMTLTLLLILIVSVFGINGVVSAQQEQTSYVVQRGDTLRLIATRYGITWQDIAIANSLTNREMGGGDPLDRKSPKAYVRFKRFYLYERSHYDGD